MLELGNEQFSVALVNAALLALWPVLPVLLLGYARQSLSARRICPEFSLRTSEAVELERAVRLYQDVCARLNQLYDQSDGPYGLWHAILYGDDDGHPGRGAELEDLQAHAHHLRGAIIRLKRQPLRRLRSWVHVVNSQFALGGAVAGYVVAFAVVIVVCRILWADELTGYVKDPSVWYPLDIQIFYANAVAAGSAAIVGPVFYLVRWGLLRRERGVEFCAFKEFAESEFDHTVDPLRADQPLRQADLNQIGADQNWFAVLGLSHSATVAEVKEAYKTLIKQNHPDRVHGMSPVFSKLAEAQTRRLNAAYQHALGAVSSLESGGNTAPV